MSLPYGYYNDIQSSETATFVPLVPRFSDEFAGGRNLYRAIDEEKNLTAPGVILCHVPTFFRWTQITRSVDYYTYADRFSFYDDVRLIDTSTLAYDSAAGVLLAIHHFNNGIGAVVDQLEDINQNCSIRFTTESIDTMAWDLRTSFALWEKTVLTSDFDDGRNPLMGALIGTSLSTTSTSLAAQTSVLELPQFSPSATSTLLDNNLEYPLFGRTIPSDRSTANLLLQYLQKELQVNFLAVLYINDAYGSSFQQAIRSAAFTRNMTAFPFALPTDLDTADVRKAMEYLQNREVNYIVGIFYPEQYETIMSTAYTTGMAGPDAGKLWVFTASLDAIFADDKVAFLNQGSVSGSAAAKASHGNAIFHAQGGLPGLPQYDRFLKEWSNIANDDEAIEYINGMVPEWDSWHTSVSPDTNFSFTRRPAHFLVPPSFAASFAYDATVALGLGACSAQDPIGMDANTTFSGIDHFFKTTLQEPFLGASGLVEFGGVTGTELNSRAGNTTYFVLSNIRVQRNDGGSSVFVSVPTMFTGPRSPGWSSYRNATFIYPDNSTVPFPEVPPIEPTLLSISSVTRGICLFLSAFGTLTAISLLIFTIAKRNHRVIKASQPEFLALLNVGCMLMSLSIIPSSMDTTVASVHGCTIACNSKFWLGSTGFCLAVTALFSKLWRINIVMKNAKGFKRVKVLPKDVIAPLVVLLGLNLLVLIVWLIVDPLKWDLVTIIEDSIFKRPILVQGECSGQHRDAFLGALLAINGIAIGLTLWQAYLARNIRTDLSESKYIGYSAVSIFEATFIGIPVAFSVRGQVNPTLFITSAILFISVVAMLGFIMGPKCRAWYQEEKQGKEVMKNFQDGSPVAHRTDSSAMSELQLQIKQLQKEIENLKFGAQETAKTAVDAVNEH